MQTLNLCLATDTSEYTHLNTPRIVVAKCRVHHFRNYPKCFIGEQAVQWMLRPGKVADVHCVEDALVLGRELMEIGTFHHVSDGMFIMISCGSCRQNLS